MAKSSSLHRIYQGRINRAWYASKGKGWKSSGQSQRMTDWSQALADAHVLFQTAVNWYLLGLASLVTEDHPRLGGMRRQLAECWDDYDRRHERRRGLRYSLAPALGFAPTASFDEAVQRMLAGNIAHKTIRQKAVDLLIHAVSGGDGAIQQEGRTYLPRFCWSGYSGGWACDATATANKEGKRRIAEFIHREPPPDPQAIAEMAKQFSMGWLVALQPDKWMDEQAARKQTDKALEHFLNPPDPEARVAKAATQIPGLRETLASLRENLALTRIGERAICKNRKAPKDRTFAAILFKVAPSPHTMALLRLVVAKPKQSISPDPRHDVEPFSIDGHDPIQLARGQRGYIFPAFTAQPDWGAIDSGQPVWKEFDTAAFKEALKTINQISQKQTERDDERARVLAELAWMNGETNPDEARTALRKGKSQDEDDDDLPGVLGNDPRVAVLERVLREDLAITNQLTDGDSLAYTLRSRTLRGWRELCARWNEEADRKPDTTPERLIALCDEHQAAHRDDAGGIAFFRAMSARDCWPIWRTPTDAERSVRNQHHWSDDLIRDYAHQLELREEAERLTQPIRFTPADAEQSPRLLMLSDLVGSSFRLDGTSARVHVPVLQQGRWQKSVILVDFTAPRLIRDGWIGGEAVHWLPPVAAALGLPKSADQDLAEGAALALMPRRQRDGSWAHLVNIPIKIDVAALQQALPRRLSPTQFVGTKDKHLHLHWPGTKGTKADWWKVLDGFRALSVDLGQRAAVAWALLEASANQPSSHAWVLGTADRRTWTAGLSSCGLSPLPGEDDRGRCASPDETAAARDLLARLGESHLDDDGRLALMRFPEQNDLLLVAARRTQGRLARLHRWVWMLSESALRARALDEIDNPERLTVDAHAIATARRGNVVPLDQALRIQLAELSAVLPCLLVELTTRIVPIQDSRWEWRVEGGHGRLLRVPHRHGTPVKIRGQRGLSLARIDQIEELRRRWLSFNRAQERKAGERPPSARELRAKPLPEPCPDLLAKLEQLKDDRIDQTAHLILAEALGVRLKPHALTPEVRLRGDHHGEYERIREPVDAVVLEDLGRYRADQGRSPRENSRLMQWAHRAILGKVKLLCEPFGIPVVEVNAAYSSRFCSRTGVAGFRAVEVTSADRHRWPWNGLLAEANAAGESAREDAKRARALFALFDHAPSIAPKPGQAIVPQRTLLWPRAGGPLFVPMRDWPEAVAKDGGTLVTRHGIQQADINAAINIGLRALAGPMAFSIRQRVRVEPAPDGGMTALCVNKLELARGLVSLPDLGEERARATWFIDQGEVAPDTWTRKDHAIRVAASITIAGQAVRIATGRALWGAVKHGAWDRVMQINRARLGKWQDKDTKRQAPF